MVDEITDGSHESTHASPVLTLLIPVVLVAFSSLAVFSSAWLSLASLGLTPSVADLELDAFLPLLA